jgi:hypothetical protein
MPQVGVVGMATSASAPKLLSMKPDEVAAQMTSNGQKRSVTPPLLLLLLSFFLLFILFGVTPTHLFACHYSYDVIVVIWYGMRRLVA